MHKAKQGKPGKDSHSVAEFSVAKAGMRWACLVRDTHTLAHTEMHKYWSNDQPRSCPPVPGRAQVSGVWMGCRADAGSAVHGTNPAHRERWEKTPHAKSAPCLQCLCRALETLASGLSGEDAASPAITGDPPLPLRPKPQAGWTSQAQRKLST